MPRKEPPTIAASPGSDQRSSSSRAGADLLRIEEPAPAPRIAPTLDAFLELGFRPLYLAGAAWAAIAIAIWIFAPQWIPGPLAGVVWHAHEMLWGFVATIAVGFLMTAGAAWTGVNPLRGTLLGLVCALWLVARIGFLAGGEPAYAVAAAAEIGFFGIAGIAMMRAVLKSKNARNYAVPWLLLALGAADALFLWTALYGDYGVVIRSFNAGLLCMALIALLIARRVTPFFAMRAVSGLKIPMHTRSGQVQLAAGAIAVVLLLAGSWVGTPVPLAIALALAGAISLVQIVAWKPMAVRHQPLLWILYVGHAGLGLGLLFAAAHALGWTLRPAVHVHVMAMAGFGVLIIGMITRTALGHLGRPLQLDRSMATSYVLMLIAVALRLGALVPSTLSELALDLSAVAWIAAFGLYLWRFVPMMIRARPDRVAAGPAVVVQAKRS